MASNDVAASSGHHVTPPEGSHIGGTRSPRQGMPDKDLVVGRSVKTKLLKKINGGSFGDIYLGELLSSGDKVAVKLELQNSKHPQLLLEGSVYRHLEGGPGIPQTFWFGMHEPLYNVLVMELLGPSLQDLFLYCKRRFSLKTVLILIEQMVDMVEFFHKNHYIHRDIKPDNLMIGRGDRADMVFIIDYGLAKKVAGYRKIISHSHYHVAHALVGTARYASVHAHLGHEDSTRDDMEALAYVWIYFLKGKLPWQGIQLPSRSEKFGQIKDTKINLPVSELCEGLPEEFVTYLNYCRHLRLDDTPDYVQIKQLFSNLATKNDIKCDKEYDWVIRKRETGEEVKYFEVDEEHLSSSA